MLESRIKQQLLSQEQIAKRVQELGQQIQRDYASVKEPIVLIGILKGSIVFMADLCRAIDRPLELEFMGVSSYGASTSSSGVVQITQDLSISIQGRHVLVVEDIVDTGLTAKYLLENFATRSPASLKVCSLLEKPAKSRGVIQIDYLGFSIPDAFVVGYGLDLNGQYRNLPYVGIFQAL